MAHTCTIPFHPHRRGPWIAFDERMKLHGGRGSDPPEGAPAAGQLPDTSQDERESAAYERVVIQSARGPIETHFYCREDMDCGAIYVGGVGGDFDTPARGLYPALCTSLIPSRVCGLRVRLRDSRNMDESVSDVLAALRFLHEMGVQDTAVVGHSFGAAVVARAAASSNRHSSFVRAVILLATQAHGVEALADLAPRSGVLIIHGTADTVLPPSCAQYAHQIAHEPKKLTLYHGAGHALDEVANEVNQEVCEWILDFIRPSWGWS